MTRRNRVRYVVIARSQKAITTHGTFYDRNRAEDYANRIAAGSHANVSAIVRPLDETTLSTVWGLHA